MKEERRSDVHNTKVTERGQRARHIRWMHNVNESLDTLQVTVWSQLAKDVTVAARPYLRTCCFSLRKPRSILVLTNLDKVPVSSAHFEVRIHSNYNLFYYCSSNRNTVHTEFTYSTGKTSFVMKTKLRSNNVCFYVT